MIEAMTEELDIPVSSGGSTTLKAELKQRGAEPDECYYVANEPQMRGREDYDPAVDPPPDVVIEVHVSRNSLDKFAIYADFGVPEIWTYEDDALSVHQLQGNGAYAQRDQSPAFPFLPLESIRGFLDRRNATDETTWIRTFRNWVRKLSRGNCDLIRKGGLKGGWFVASPKSQGLVRETGLEPARPCGHQALNLDRVPTAGVAVALA